MARTDVLHRGTPAALALLSCLCLAAAAGADAAVPEVRYEMNLHLGEVARTVVLHAGESYAAATARFCDEAALTAEQCEAVLDRFRAVGPYVPTVQPTVEPKRKVAPAFGDRTELLLFLCARTGASRYLEIGCDQDQSFATLRKSVHGAVGVDPAQGGTYRGTSDEFFAEALGAAVPEKFDVVFVDGLHRWEYALRDAANALELLAPGGIVAMHDMNPQSATTAQRDWPDHGVWNGDVYRALVHLRRQPDLDVAVLDMDYGCALVVKRPNSRPLPDGVTDEHLASLDYATLDSHRDLLLNLIAAEDAAAWLDGEAAAPPAVFGVALPVGPRVSLMKAVANARAPPGVPVVVALPSGAARGVPDFAAYSEACAAAGLPYAAVVRSGWLLIDGTTIAALGDVDGDAAAVAGAAIQAGIRLLDE